MRAPITDKHLLEMMWERFPEIMRRGTEQPAQQEPVARYIGEGSEGSLVQLYEDLKKGTDLYTSPPAQRTWVGLSEEEKIKCASPYDSRLCCVEETEAKLKEKNTP